MGIEGIINKTKDFLVKEIAMCPSNKEDASTTGIKAAAGFLGFYLFDNYLLETACLTYAVIKTVQYVNYLAKSK